MGFLRSQARPGLGQVSYCDIQLGQSSWSAQSRGQGKHRAARARGVGPGWGHAALESGWGVTGALRSDPRPGSWTCEPGGPPGPCARESPALGLALLLLS